MKAIKSFLLKVWTIVSAIKPEEAMVSQPRFKFKSRTTIRIDHEGFFEALKQDIEGKQSLRCENNSSQSIFSFTAAELTNAAESALSKIDLQDNRLTVRELHQEVAKEAIRLKLKSGGKK